MVELMNTLAQLRVAIWCRTSDKKKNTSDAIPNQERRGRQFAKDHGGTVVESCVYRLKGISGGKLRGSSYSERLLDDAEYGLFDVVVVTNIPRFARDTKHCLETAEFLWDHGIELYILDDNIDTSTPEGRRKFAYQAAEAQYGRETSYETSRNAQKGRIRGAQDGDYNKPLGGRPAFGYAMINGTFAPDPVGAPIRIELYHRFLALPNLKQLAQWLNGLGHRTPKGKAFRDTDIRDMLEDPIVIGHRRLNSTKRVPGKNQSVKKPRDEWVYAPIVPLIDRTLWEDCQALLANMETGRPKDSLCSGKVFCQSCDPEGSGRKLYARKNQAGIRCGKCKLQVSEMEIEELILQNLSQYTSGSLLITRATLDLEIQRAEVLLQAQIDQKALLSENATSLSQEIEADSTEVVDIMERLCQQEVYLEQLAATLAGLNRKVTALKGRESFELTIPALWARLNLTEKNFLVDRLISFLTLMHNGEVAVELRTPFPDGFGPLRI